MDVLLVDVQILVPGWIGRRKLTETSCIENRVLGEVVKGQLFTHIGSFIRVNEAAGLQGETPSVEVPDSLVAVEDDMVIRVGCHTDGLDGS